MAAGLVSVASELLFPRFCVLCKAWTELGSDSLCSTCKAGIDQERRVPCCPTCARSVAPYGVVKQRCGHCRKRVTRLTATARIGRYHGPLGTLLRSYKYKGHDELEPLLTEWLSEVLREAAWIEHVEAVLCVPTHWRHRINRPFHAAEALALSVARQHSLPYVPILRRVRGGPHQIMLSYTARVENVRGAFRLRKGVTLHAPRLLLIDDVMTTGATLDECAKVLRAGGAAEVYGAIVACAD